VGLFFLPRYVRDWLAFARSAGQDRLRLADSYPCLTDWSSSTPFDPHYFYQGAWLARRLADRKPNGLHVDVGSSVLTISVLSAFTETAFVDLRPLGSRLRGLHSIAADVGRLPFADRSIASVSCLHVIEHIGLGRYGDDIDPRGSVNAAGALAALTAPGGRLYLSTPVGRERVCFNAHRVFAPETIAGWFSDMRLVEFSCIDDAGFFHEDVPMTSAAHYEYGCGLFVLERPASEPSR
jgi:hypothetical protein